jgi:hypothetical protein
MMHAHDGRERRDETVQTEGQGRRDPNATPVTIRANLPVRLATKDAIRHSVAV